MVQAKKSAKRLAKSTLLLVPQRAVSGVNEAAVCVDVTLSAPQMRSLRDLCGADKLVQNRFSFEASVEGEPEAALVLQLMSPTRMHVTVEFRRGKTSPYASIKREQMSKIVALLMTGTDKKIGYSSYSRSLEHPEGSERKLFTGTELADGGKLHLAGMEFEIRGAEGKPLRGMKLRFGDGGAMQETVWSRESEAVESLEQAFVLASKKTVSLPAATTS